MPCDTRRTITLEWLKVDLGLLAASLTASGFDVTETADRLYFSVGNQFGTHQAGRLTLSDGLQANAIRQNYSRAAVDRACKRNRWQTRTNRTGKIVATRRRKARR